MKYILAILALGLLIIVHELGHFIMAKINKVKVEEFSIGMGPKIFTYQGKETKYSLSLLPVGGYVQMLGAHEDVDEEGSFNTKSPFRRLTIIIAGVVMNFILAILIFTAVTVHFGYGETSISKLTDDGALKSAGLQEGDNITKINGSKVFTYYDITIATGSSKGEEMEISYERGGDKYEVTVTPKYLEDEQRYVVGATFNYNSDPSIIDGVKQSFKETATLVTQTLKSIGNLITGHGNFKTDLGGPVTVVNLSAQAAESGLWDLMNLVGLLSISLAVFNLLPFPALDGGWSVLLLIEMITKRKVPEKVVGVINGIGFICLMALMVVVTVKDILFPASF